MLGLGWEVIQGQRFSLTPCPLARCLIFLIFESSSLSVVLKKIGCEDRYKPIIFMTAGIEYIQTSRTRVHSCNLLWKD